VAGVEQPLPSHRVVAGAPYPPNYYGDQTTTQPTIMISSTDANNLIKRMKKGKVSMSVGSVSFKNPSPPGTTEPPTAPPAKGRRRRKSRGLRAGDDLDGDM